MLSTIRHLLDSSSSLQDALTTFAKPSSFSIVSWNTLAQRYLMRSYSSSRLPPNLAIAIRRNALLKELTSRHFDFACLQEVDSFYSFWRKQLNAYGYNTLYRRRTSKTEGCCIVYSREYTCERSFWVEYNDLKEFAKLDEEEINNGQETYNCVFEPDEKLQQRAKNVIVPPPAKIPFAEYEKCITKNRSGLIAIFRHNESLF